MIDSPRNLVLIVTAVAIAVFCGGLLGRAAAPDESWSEDLLDLPPMPVAPFVGTVAKLSGTAEKRATDGRTESLRGGSTLARGESLHTGPGSSVLLRMNTGSELTVRADSEVSLADIDPDTEVYRLNRGGVDVVSESSKRQVQIVSKDGKRIAAGNRGTFTVHGLDDVLGVHTHRGAVGLAAGGETLAVRKGRTAAARGAKPRAEKAGKKQTELHVDPLAKATVAAETTIVTGRADPLSLVTVNGILAEVDGQGVFTARVPLREGVNRIVVVARHVSGKERVQSMPPVRRLTETEIRDLKVRWKGTRKRRGPVKWGGASR